MIVDVDERRDAFAGLSLLLRGLLHAGAGKIADRLGAVLIAALGDHGVEFLHQFVVKRNRDAVHGVLSSSKFSGNKFSGRKFLAENSWQKTLGQQ